ncbi:MAG: hypothetical protein ABEJ72_02555, partial [Candidatus Aenigmatarchaeota archaeon]
MDVNRWYKQTAMKYFSGVAESHLSTFQDLKLDMKKADIGLSLKEYLSIAIMTVFLVFTIEFPLISFITAMLPGFSI